MIRFEPYEIDNSELVYACELNTTNSLLDMWHSFSNGYIEVAVHSDEMCCIIGEWEVPERNVLWSFKE